ncbi:MAG: hypothetical protein IJ637_07420 [Prevotella sp.]|nr:hypothetical protein [Prevotella sp.]
MKKTFTRMMMLAAVASMLPLAALAGDGTKENPYTVAELNAQKDALAASAAAVWVKADLRGLGEDGTMTDNADTEDASGKTVHHMAALFGDETGTFVAYSYQILSGLNIADLTNTKGLLISLTYGTTGHPHGNSANPQYATDYEKDVVTDAHFSLEEVHGALSLEIKGGYRGYHIPASYIVPKDIVAVRVNTNYTAAKGSSVNYGYYDGAEEGKNYIINKNTALVLMAYDGTYDVTLSAGHYEQINSNGLVGGKNAGVNTITTADRWHFRFVATDGKAGFERNGSTDKEVVLDSKDEIYLTVNAKDTHFAGSWAWETADKKWISWQGNSITDFTTHTSAISELAKSVNSKSANSKCYSLQGLQLRQPQKGINIVNGKKVLKK